MNTKPLYAYATVAHHQLGDISRFETGEFNLNEDTLVEHGVSELSEHVCEIWEETQDDWIGNWITGMGFVKVKFPKETTRALIPEEIEKFEKMNFRISDGPSYNYSNIQTI